MNSRTSQGIKTQLPLDVGEAYDPPPVEHFACTFCHGGALLVLYLAALAQGLDGGVQAVDHAALLLAGGRRGAHLGKHGHQLPGKKRGVKTEL